MKESDCNTGHFVRLKPTSKSILTLSPHGVDYKIGVDYQVYAAWPLELRFHDPQFQLHLRSVELLLPGSCQENERKHNPLARLIQVYVGCRHPQLRHVQKTFPSRYLH